MAEDHARSEQEPNAWMPVLALLAAIRDDANVEPGQRRRTEVVLADVGMSLQDIALVTGRKYEAVKTTVRRARERAAAETKAARSSADGRKEQ